MEIRADKLDDFKAYLQTRFADAMVGFDPGMDIQEMRSRKMTPVTLSPDLSEEFERADGAFQRFMNNETLKNATVETLDEYLKSEEALRIHSVFKMTVWIMRGLIA